MSQPDQTSADKERLKCPHCGGHLVTRSSRSVTPLFREKTMQCRNPACGASFGTSTGITHQISPSACPNPSVTLPVSPPRARKEPANDDQPKKLDSGSEVPRAHNDDRPAGLTG